MREKSKILLLQARVQGDPARSHEHRCFADCTGFALDDVVCHDLVESVPALSEVQRYGAMMVGGSGAFYVSRGDMPNFDAFLLLLRQVVAVEHPSFLSCYGFGALVCALGGEMIHDPEQAEVGSFDLYLTPSGRADEVFGDLPLRFVAQLGHKDRAVDTPPGVVNLASSPRSPVQGLRVPGAPIWATQFHPELDGRTNLERFEIYMDDYGPGGDAAREEVRASFRESPQAAELLGRFVDLIFPDRSPALK